MLQDFCVEPPMCLTGFLDMSCNFFVEGSIPRYCAAQIFKRVIAFQLCAISGDAWLSTDTVWRRLEQDFCLPLADHQAKRQFQCYQGTLVLSGMVNYLTGYSTKLKDSAEPVRELCKKATLCNWQSCQQSGFEANNEEIIKTLCLCLLDS